MVRALCLMASGHAQRQALSSTATRWRCQAALPRAGAGQLELAHCWAVGYGCADFQHLVDPAGLAYCAGASHACCAELTEADVK